MSEPRRYPRPALLDQVRPGTTAIEASAGTGKTWTLERLVVDLLLTRGLTLDQILVVTYTEKAASEMLERIRSLLQLLATGGFKEAKPGEPAWALGPRELRLLETALGSFDRAGISTIHAFCQRVLAETAFLSGRPFETELAPGAELFQAEFQTILRQRWAADPHQRDLLAFGMGLFGSEAKLLEFLVEADKASRVGDFELESAGPCAFDPAGAVALPWRSAQDVQAALQESGIASATAVPMARRFAVFLRSCEQAQAAGSPWPVLAALGSSNAMTSPQLQRITERREASGPVGELCRAYLEALALRTSWCAMLVQAFLPELQAGVAARKEREALVDFDDLIGLVRAALADPDGGPALAGRLRTRYRAVLVDEFQDANSDQWDIFRTAFQGGDTFLVLIGDPKQAIYGFRGGDVPTYLEARDSVDGPDRRIPLDRNFRSTPRMIAGYNRLLTGPDGQDTLEARFFSGEIRYERLVQAGAAGLDWQDPSGRSLPPVHLVEFLLDQENRATDRLGAWVTQALAKEIADLLERGTVFLDPENDDPEQRSQPVQPQDIFILVRSTRDGLAAAEALRARGVPVAFYKQEGLGRSVEARQVLDLLRAVEEPGNASVCALAWLTPFFGLELGDLGSTGDLPEDHPLRARLLEWHGLARKRRYPELYRGLLDHSGLVRRLLAKPDPAAERTLGIMLQLLEHILEQGASRNLEFDRLVAEMDSFIERGILPPGENPDTHRMETDRGAVQVLTMHKAKGLEAKVVALIGKYSDTNGRENQQAFRVRRRHECRQGRNRRITWFGSKAVPAPYEIAHKQELREEEERLLYVALTRAKACLLLPYFKVRPGADFNAQGAFSGDGNPKGQYGILNRRLQAFERNGWLLPELFTVSPAPAGAELQGTVPPRADPPPLTFGDLPAFAAIAEQGRAPRTWSFTSITRSLDLHAQADPENHTRRRLGEDEFPGGNRAGSCLHKMLELVPLETVRESADATAWTAREEIQDLLGSTLEAHSMDRKWTPAAAALVHAALAMPLALPAGGTLPGIARAEQVLREMDFTFLRGPGTDFFEGSIDLLFRWRGRVCFVDWKSNVLDGYGPRDCARTVADAYALQAKIYTLAVVRFLGIASLADYESGFGGGIYLFLRGAPGGLGSHAFRPDWDEVLAWQAELGVIEKELAHERS